MSSRVYDVKTPRAVELGGDAADGEEERRPSGVTWW